MHHGKSQLPEARESSIKSTSFKEQGLSITGKSKHIN